MVEDVAICSARLPGGLGRIVKVGGAWQPVLQEQAIGFLSHRGGRVAYAVTGSGPLLLLDVGRAHHLEAFWRFPPYRRFVLRLAARFTVVRWDRPGFGLSDRHAVDLSPEAELALIERLAGFLGADELAVLAADDAGPGMIRFAARHPERVSRLALFGTAADGRRLAPPLPARVVRALVSAGPSAIHGLVAAATANGSEPDVGDWLAAALEASADVAAIIELLTGAGPGDAGGDLGLVRAPTLVLQRDADAVLDPELGRELAAGIAGAHFVAVPGRAHLVYAGDAEPVLRAVVPFLMADEAEPNREQALSQRELEVAGMVTLGLTNAEIGRRLAIRRRTVDAHLEHIRLKLGVTTRTRIATWAVNNRLVVVAD